MNLGPGSEDAGRGAEEPETVQSEELRVKS
jgi:hypothetical protein